MVWGSLVLKKELIAMTEGLSSVDYPVQFLVKIAAEKYKKGKMNLMIIMGSK